MIYIGYPNVQISICTQVQYFLFNIVYFLYCWQSYVHIKRVRQALEKIIVVLEANSGLASLCSQALWLTAEIHELPALDRLKEHLKGRDTRLDIPLDIQ